MKKEQFITERTRIISNMLDNPDKYGIYPTTKCFNELDELYEKIVIEAISDHDQAKWKKYPENVPEIIETEYIVTAYQDVVFIAYFDDGWLVNGIDISEKVIAFRELAAPYQEGGDNG